LIYKLSGYHVFELKTSCLHNLESAKDCDIHVLLLPVRPYLMPNIHAGGQ